MKSSVLTHLSSKSALLSLNRFLYVLSASDSPARFTINRKFEFEAPVKYFLTKS